MDGFVDSMQSMFDEKWYCHNHPGIVGNPLKFFCDIGWRRGDNPSALFLTEWYRTKYPDVAAYDTNPLEHFVDAGMAEGRTPNPLFDPAWYSDQARPGGGSGLWNHFCTSGWVLGLSPHPLFSSDWYLAAHPDVQAANMNPLIHYLTSGVYEGRRPSQLFDVAWYLEQYPVAAKTVGGPLVDFLIFGATIGRNPSPYFDVREHRLRHMRLQDGALNPLVHHMLTILKAEPLSDAASGD